MLQKLPPVHRPVKDREDVLPRQGTYSNKVPVVPQTFHPPEGIKKVHLPLYRKMDKRFWNFPFLS
jgi:hypothetical protein